MLGDPTIYDIAKRAGVGIATVSRVLNGSERVASATRLAVQRAMVELGFRPNRAARRLAVRGPNRQRVAALMPFFSASFYFSVSKPLSLGLAAADLDFVLYNIQDRDDKNRVLDRLVREHACEGLVLCSMGIPPERVAQLQQMGIPVVSVEYALPGVPSVTVDNVAAGTRAARYLQRGGSKALALITGSAETQSFLDREEGFVAVAGSEAPQLRAEAITPEAGRAAAAALLDHHAQVDGIVCVNDMIAVGVLEELNARGRQVPRDVQVIGFDDQPLMDVIGLSTIRQPMGEFGAWAAEAIATLLHRPTAGKAASVAALELPVVLVPRATTRAPRAARTGKESP